MASTSPAATVPVAKDTMSTTPPLKRKECDVVSKASAPKRFCLAVTACPRRGVSLSVGATRKVGSFTAKALYSTTAPLRWVIRKTLKRKSAVKDAEDKKQPGKKEEEKENKAKTSEGQSSTPTVAVIEAVKVEEKTVQIHVEAQKGASKKAKTASNAPVDKQNIMQAGA
mmetsp:Transcript_17545/g.26512  ORF Transcript_17545/g.26512 Transcript_17545/m.26512 type:complete len:169 (+) Transcript_17545:86-592(+)|eukprot:CAMPEP_0206473590 /NCGR_PEP_ID=MMETSP0324_2-20121206/32968_1 /ASSEMBLY_ACC=CAM_ASM_000836 /TAXON_ID=2866 /ORGANISM="Crypthecodinium cohnii, Strain Seligo" /LENGTH=168 /DNA_ID=CAMNT_0053948573 /DNA_START=59 /DNA_END=565 /DNA_ORIENTATION=-